MMHRFVKALGLICLSLFALPALAQDTAPVPVPSPAAPGGEPLPPFTIQFKTIESIVPGTSGGFGAPQHAEFSGNVRLVWGDVTLRADHMVYDSDNGKIEATGNIVFVRGPETVRGESVTFFLNTGSFAVQKGTVSGPQYFVYGERVERINGVLRAYRGRIAPNSEGKGEVQLTAREIRFVENEYVDLLDMRVSLFGKRILTLPAYRIQQRYGPRKGDIPNIPLRVKYTRISGLAFGVGNSWKLAKNTQGDAIVFFPSKNGPQYQLIAGYDIFGNADQPPPFLRRRRDDSLFDVVGATNEKPKAGAQSAPAGPSPLRRFLKVEKGTGPDPVLDFKSILEAPEALARPLEEPSRFAIATATFSGKEENGNKRQGNLLLSRQPEARIITSYPLRAATDHVFQTNAEARRYLASPRFALSADLVAGSYTERRISLMDELKATTPTQERSQRIGGTVGVNLLPLLIGSKLLLRSNLSYNSYQYDGGDRYTVPEIGFSAAYVADAGTLIGAAVYHRQPSGRTPFFFDQIDTRTEAQGVLQGHLSSKINTALLLRYDLSQQRLFDWAYTIGFRGRTIEPRLSYRKLGGQFGLGFNFAGF